MPSKLTLYDYYRSSASFRVRVALNLKQLDFSQIPINLLNQEQSTTDYLQINPQGLVPCLEDNGKFITQSLAILEYLDEKFPSPPLLPVDPLARAYVRSLAFTIGCDIHPLNNLRVLNYLKENFLAPADQVKRWYHHWLKKGFDAFEAQLSSQNNKGKCCYQDQVTLADLCLIPQVYNAQRYEFPMDNYPIINAINTYCLKLEAFRIQKPEERQ